MTVRALTISTTRALVSALALSLACAFAVGLHAQQTRDQRAAPRAGGSTATAGLSGTVVTDEPTPQPIRRAAVTVASVDGTVNLTTYTNEAGRFTIAGLPGGRYTLAASKAPYLRATYGARRADVPGTTITLKDGSQMTDIVLRMPRGAVITGRVTDDNGEPVFGVTVRAMQGRGTSGERTFAPPTSGSSSDTTDDRGVFRFYGLPPGDYVVSASPRIWPGEVRAMTEDEIRATLQAVQQRAQAAQATMSGGNPPTVTPTPTPTPDIDKVTVAYAPVYYPGTTVASSATPITVAASDERTGVDISLRLVRTTTVEGVVLVPQGIAPQSVQLMMMPTSAGVGAGGLMGLELISQRVVPGPDGKFAYTGVAPGQYTISARATRQAAGQPPPPPGVPAQAATFAFSARIATSGGSLDDVVMPVMLGGGDPNATQYWAQADVSVDGVPVSGVTLALQPGMTIAGRIEFRTPNVRPGGDPKSVQLGLSPVSTPGAMRISLGSTSTQIDDTGQFTIGGVTPGRYRLSGAVMTNAAAAMPQMAPWRLASALVKGRDMLDFPLDVAPGDAITDAVVTFTDVTQEIFGSLQDASGRPAPDFTIVVFAADSRYWTPQSRRIRTARPGTDGRFTVTGLPPGEYRMAAVADLAPGEINEPAFLEQLVPASVPIALGAGEKKTQDLRISGGL